MSQREKVTVSIGAEELAWARERADTAQESVSDVLTEALRLYRDSEGRLSLEEMASLGITEDALAAVRAARRSHRP